VSGVLGLAVQPLQQARQAVEQVTGAAPSAIHALRDLVDAVDLTAVTTAVQRALQPVVDTLDAIEAAVGTAEDAIRGVCQGIQAGLQTVADAVGAAAATITAGLGKAKALLDGLHLQDLAAALSTALTGVAATLASAQLSPYFDSAISVIDTGTSVINAVPFGLLVVDLRVAASTTDPGPRHPVLGDVQLAELAVSRTSVAAPGPALFAVRQALGVDPLTPGGPNFLYVRVRNLGTADLGRCGRGSRPAPAARRRRRRPGEGRGRAGVVPRPGRRPGIRRPPRRRAAPGLGDVGKAAERAHRRTHERVDLTRNGRDYVLLLSADEMARIMAEGRQARAQ